MSLATGPARAIPPGVGPARPRRPRLEAFARAHPLLMLACGFLALSAVFDGGVIAFMHAVSLIYVVGQTLFTAAVPDEGPYFLALVAIQFLVLLGVVRLSWKVLLILGELNSGRGADPVAPIKAAADPPSGLWDRDLDEPL